MQTELQQLLAMLTRAGIGHGTRTDWNPPGTAVQVETEALGDDIPDQTVTEFAFDELGVLQTVCVYIQEEG